MIGSVAKQRKAVLETVTEQIQSLKAIGAEISRAILELNMCINNSTIQITTLILQVAKLLIQHLNGQDLELKPCKVAEKVMKEEIPNQELAKVVSNEELAEIDTPNEELSKLDTSNEGVAQVDLSTQEYLPGPSGIQKIVQEVEKKILDIPEDFLEEHYEVMKMLKEDNFTFTELEIEEDDY